MKILAQIILIYFEYNVKFIVEILWIKHIVCRWVNLLKSVANLQVAYYSLRGQSEKVTELNFKIVSMQYVFVLF